MDGLCHPCKDTANGDIPTSKDRTGSWQDPRGTQTPTYFTQHILPPKKESTSLLSISKAIGDPCILTPKKGSRGICPSLVQEEENRRCQGNTAPTNPGTPSGSTFPCTRGGTVGNSTTYSPGLASWHLGVSTNPQQSTFLSPCYVSSTVLPIRVVTDAHGQLFR